MSEEKPLLNPEEFRLAGPDGKERVYILSDFDAVAWRHIVSQYPVTALPKVGDYAENEKLMYKIFSYVAVVTNDGRRLRLETEALVNNHIPNGEMLVKIEMKMMEKNVSFFRDGKILSLFEKVIQVVVKSLSETLILSLEQSSVLEKQLSTSLEQSTTEKMPS
jgi:hypothetical protein